MNNNKIEKITRTFIETSYQVNLSEMSDDDIKDNVLGSLAVIDKFLKSGRKLGFIETIRSPNDESIFPEINEEQYQMQLKFNEIKFYIQENLKSN